MNQPMLLYQYPCSWAKRREALDQQEIGLQAWNKRMISGQYIAKTSGVRISVATYIHNYKDRFIWLLRDRVTNYLGWVAYNVYNYFSC